MSCSVAGSSNAEVMTVAQFVQKQASKPDGNHYAMIYAFLTMLDVDGNVKRVTAHRWYNINMQLVCTYA